MEPRVAITLVKKLLGVRKRLVRLECQKSYSVRLDWLKQLFKGKATNQSTVEELE